MSKRKSHGDTALESLRLDYTDLNQDEFIVKCGISRTTYQRWLRDNKLPRLTPEQIIKICRVCHISFKTFFSRLGFEISDVPDDLPMKKQK